MRALNDTPFELQFDLEGVGAPTVMNGVPRRHGELARAVHFDQTPNVLTLWVGLLENDVEIGDWIEVYCDQSAPEAQFVFEVPSEGLGCASSRVEPHAVHIRATKQGSRLLVVQYRGAWSAEELERRTRSVRFVAERGSCEATRTANHEMDLPPFVVPASVTIQPTVEVDRVQICRLERWLDNELVGRISFSPNVSWETGLQAQLGGWVAEAQIDEVRKRGGGTILSPTGTELFGMRVSTRTREIVISGGCPGRNLSPGLWMIHRRLLVDLIKQVIS